MKGRLQKERTRSSCNRDSRTLFDQTDELSSFEPYFSTSGGERESARRWGGGGGGGQGCTIKSGSGWEIRQ